MELHEIKAVNEIKSELFNENDLNRIKALSNDISELRDFIEKLKAHKDDKIEGLYIRCESGYQIELKGRFSKDAGNKLLDLIIESRMRLSNSLARHLIDLSNELKQSSLE
jgi:hypothetical protein